MEHRFDLDDRAVVPWFLAGVCLGEVGVDGVPARGGVLVRRFAVWHDRDDISDVVLPSGSHERGELAQAP